MSSEELVNAKMESIASNNSDSSDVYNLIRNSYGIIFDSDLTDTTQTSLSILFVVLEKWLRM